MAVSKGSKNHSTPGAAGALARHPLLWLNVACLDAPLIALSWQLLFAHTFAVPISPAEGAALFLSAWGIYLVDRFADSIALKPGTERSVRVHFCLRHQNRRAVLLLIVGLADGAIIVAGLTPEIIWPGVALAVIALLYLLVNHFFSKLWQTIPIKEVAIGFLFAAGVVLVLWSRAGQEAPRLLLTAILFGGLCSLNCMSIAVWERDLDKEQGKHSCATDRPRAGAFVLILTAIVALVCLAEVVAIPAIRPLTICLGSSATLLLALHILPMARDERTALADLVLLTPLLFLVAAKIL